MTFFNLSTIRLVTDLDSVIKIVFRYFTKEGILTIIFFNKPSPHKRPAILDKHDHPLPT